MCSIFCSIGLAQAQFIVIDDIEIEGNKKTKNWVILRELNIGVGDSVLIADTAKVIRRNQKQLLNSELFNEAQLQFNGNTLEIKVAEKWYFWPIPVIDLADRNFNQWWLSRDPRRLIYGTELKLENLRGRNERLFGDLTLGYTRQANLTYEIPVFEKYQNLGMEVNAALIANKEVWYKTDSNKVKFYNNVDEIGIVRAQASIDFIRRRGVNQYQSYGFAWRQTQVTDSVIQLNPEFLGESSRNLNIFSLRYGFILDKRDIRGQPLKGNYWNVQLAFHHLPEFSNQWAPELRYRSSHYLPLGGKWFTSGGLHLKWSERQPFRFNRAIGYDYNVLRGYEFYVADGESSAVFKTNLKYALLLNKKYNFGFIPVETYKEANNTLFLLAFYDGGYVANSNPLSSNTFTNRYLNGFGVGVEWVVWYDRMIRFEWSQNHTGENGIYVSFKMGV